MCNEYVFIIFGNALKHNRQHALVVTLMLLISNTYNLKKTIDTLRGAKSWQVSLFSAQSLTQSENAWNQLGRNQLQVALWEKRRGQGQKAWTFQAVWPQ